MIRKIIEQFGIVNFSPEEITQGQNNIPKIFIYNIIPTLCILQEIRTLIDIPVYINSTYRTPEHNREVKGARKSLHLIFNAIDFTPSLHDPDFIKDLYNRICEGDFSRVVKFDLQDFNGRNFKFYSQELNLSPQIMGVGLYESFIHIDTRGLLGYDSPARWSYTHKKTYEPIYPKIYKPGRTM